MLLRSGSCLRGKVTIFVWDSMERKKILCQVVTEHISRTGSLNCRSLGFARDDEGGATREGWVVDEAYSRSLHFATLRSG